MRYVVTGAAGFIGSHLLRAILDRGHDAVGWDAFTDYYDPALKEENAEGLPVERLDLVQDDLPDVRGVDGIFHLAGQPGVLSYFTIYGPRQRPDMALAKMIACLVEKRPFELHGDGTQSRSFTYVDDAVEATILAMERAPAGSVLNIGGGEEVSMLEAIETLADVSRRRLELVAGSRRRGDAARTAADTSRIRAETGWGARPRLAP